MRGHNSGVLARFCEGVGRVAPRPPIGGRRGVADIPKVDVAPRLFVEGPDPARTPARPALTIIAIAPVPTTLTILWPFGR
jgi:hypothetical protein